MTTYSKHASRRRHSAELKDRVLAACDEPGASVAAVAQAHGLNANLVHKWWRSRDAKRLAPMGDIAPRKVAELPLPPRAAAQVVPSVVEGSAVTTQRAAVTHTPTDSALAFVPLQLEMPRGAPADIRLELRRGAATVVVNWPAQEAAACGNWLREWLG